jgi:hypothetical protein
MPLYISQCLYKIKKNMKAYRIGKSIILPYVRYVNHGGRNSKMFHTEAIRLNGHYQTLGCDKMDVSGFCLGHRMDREEFLERYCGGTEPEQRETKIDKDSKI